MRVDDEIKHQICLPLIGGVGDIIAKKLLINFGTAKAVFCAKKKELENEFNKA
jgi:ERCC4-type nuclease